MMKDDLAYSVSGLIRDGGSALALAGLRVRAYDKDFFRDQFLGEARTDGSGAYQIRFSRRDFTGPLLRLERHPDIFVVVYDAADREIYSSVTSVVVDCDRHTTIDIAIEGRAGTAFAAEVSFIAGMAVNLTRAAELQNHELVTAYRLAHNAHLKIEPAQLKRLREAFPLAFQPAGETGPPECGLEGPEAIRFLLRERDAHALLDPVDADSFEAGVAVKQFFTARIVVKYTVDAASAHNLPAGSATLPAADAAFGLPDGTALGTIRSSLASLDPANTEVAPTYIQKIGLLAEYALSRYIAAPFSMRDPRGGAIRLEFRILALPVGVAGYAVSSDFHMEIQNSNPDSQNFTTVPHELFHLVQYRYNIGGNVSGGVRQSTLEGGARLIEESIYDSPNRYVESAAEGSVAGSVPRKGLFQFPEESLLDVGGVNSPIRYAAGLFWKYIAENNSTLTAAANEPAIGVDAYRAIIEEVASDHAGYTIAGWRNARSRMVWYGALDQFSYYDAALTELDSNEATWPNFLVANYLHTFQTPASPGYDGRFDYMEDDATTGSFTLNPQRPSVAATNQIVLSQGSSVSRTVMGAKPYGATYFEITPSATSVPRMLRVNVSASAGLTDPMVQILRLGASNSLVDLHRSDRASYSKTLNMTGLTKVAVIVASREHGGDFTVTFDEVAAATDIMVTRWNSKAATEYEIDPRGWSWHWISPDIMVDNDDDLLEDTSVFFDQDNKLKVRLRNRGNTPASNIQVDFWYQKATPHLTSAGWIPVQDAANTTQVLTGLTLTAGAEQWFSVNWCPDNDGTNHRHWCVKVKVTVAGDPNTDNKMAFRNFSDVVVAPGPDSGFSALIRHASMTAAQELQIIPRGSRYTLSLPNGGKIFPDRPAPPCPCATQIVHAPPDAITFARYRIEPAGLVRWDGQVTAQPEGHATFYPTDLASLPPGVNPDQLVTVAHLVGGKPVGGVTYRIRDGG